MSVFNDNIKIFSSIILPEEHSFYKVLWRVSNGSRSKAMEIAKKVLKGYNLPESFTEDFENIFDAACADANGGIEVEWRED